MGSSDRLCTLILKCSLRERSRISTTDLIDNFANDLFAERYKVSKEDWGWLETTYETDLINWDYNRRGERPIEPEDLEAIQRLSSSDLKEIDDILLGFAKKDWQTSSIIIQLAILQVQDRYKWYRILPETFYSTRLMALTENSRLEVKGDLRRILYSEVRLVD